MVNYFKKLNVLFAAFLPLVFITVWLHHNIMLPIADASLYIGTGAAIYLKFTHKSIFQGVKALFFTRGWRPIMFPLITVPFLLLTHGNLLATYNCAATLLVFFNVFYIYLFLRLRLDSVSAVVSAALLGLLPSVQLTAINFFAESALLPFVIGALYHLIKSNYLTNKKHTILFVTCVVAAILMRPVEAITEFALPFGYYLFFSYQQKTLSFARFWPVLAWIIALIGIWYLPFYAETYEWIYRTSFGDVAAADPRPVLTIMEKVKFQMLCEGLVPIVGIFSLGVIGALVNRHKKIISDEILYLFLLTPLPIAEILFTIQDTPRKGAFPFTILLMIALIIGLQKSFAWGLRVSLATILLCYQFIVSMLIANPVTYNKFPTLIRYSAAGLPKPIYFPINPYDQIIDFLINQHQRYPFRGISMAIDTSGWGPVDPFVFNTLVSAKNPGFYSNYSFFGTFSQETLNAINQLDALFIADKVERLVVSDKMAKDYKKQLDNEKSISDKTMDYFLFHYANNDLNKLGWKVASCINLISLHNVNYRGCLLVKK